MMRLAFVSACLWSLAACGPSPSASGADGALPDTAMVRTVTPATTAALVTGNPDRASPSVAIQTLGLWIARLDTSSAEGTDEVRSDLERLRNLLQSSPLDGPAIGRSLRSASKGTAALADSASGLAGLARALRMAGDRLIPDTTRAPNEGAETAGGTASS